MTKDEWDAIAEEEYYKMWYEEMGDDGSNWTVDWSKPPQAFDRYAYLDGNSSMHKLKDVDGDEGTKRSKTEKKGKGKDGKDDDNHVVEPTKKKRKACKKKGQKEQKEDEEPAATEKAWKKKTRKQTRAKVKRMMMMMW